MRADNIRPYKIQRNFSVLRSIREFVLLLLTARAVG